MWGIYGHIFKDKVAIHSCCNLVDGCGALTYRPPPWRNQQTLIMTMAIKQKIKIVGLSIKENYVH